MKLFFVTEAVSFETHDCNFHNSSVIAAETAEEAVRIFSPPYDPGHHATAHEIASEASTLVKIGWGVHSEPIVRVRASDLKGDGCKIDDLDKAAFSTMKTLIVGVLLGPVLIIVAATAAATYLISRLL